MEASISVRFPIIGIIYKVQMMKKNKGADVFTKINMHNGDQSVCWEWRGTVDKDRPYYFVNKRKWIAYRLVFNLTNEEELRNDEVVRHSCDNGGAPICCCNPVHLKRGSHQDNMRDMRERSRHGMPAHTVKNIKRLLEVGKQTHKQIAELYGCSRENITAINNNRTYEIIHSDGTIDILEEENEKT